MSARRKQLVALIWIRSESGTRTYGVFDRNGNLIAYRHVHDCGYGAHVVHEWAKKEFNVSTAEWTYELARKVKNDHRY